MKECKRSDPLTYIPPRKLKPRKEVWRAEAARIALGPKRAPFIFYFRSWFLERGVHKRGGISNLDDRKLLCQMGRR